MPRLSLERAVLAAILAFAPAAARAGEHVVTAVHMPEMKAVFGEVESRIVVPARARIGGTLGAIAVAEGDMVKEGQPIAVVTDDKLALQMGAAAAKIEALSSQLENARIAFDRTQRLKPSGAVSQSQLDQARMQLDVATNNVTAAKAERDVIQQSANEGTVIAPAAGRILTVPVTQGSVVLPGEVVARIAPGPYYLRLSLPERLAADIVAGAEVTIGGRRSADDAEAPRRGHIAKVYPEIADGRVIADVDVAGLGDYFVNERMPVSIPVGSRTVIGVPPEAVRTVQGVDYVRLAPDGIDVAVITGERFEESGKPRIEVLSGLRDGDRVLLP